MSGEGFIVGFLWRSWGWAEWRALLNTGLPARGNMGQQAWWVLGFRTFSRQQGREAAWRVVAMGVKGREDGHLGWVGGGWRWIDFSQRNYYIASLSPQHGAECWSTTPGGFEQFDPPHIGMTPVGVPPGADPRDRVQHGKALRWC